MTDSRSPVNPVIGESEQTRLQEGDLVMSSPDISPPKSGHGPDIPDITGTAEPDILGDIDILSIPKCPGSLGDVRLGVDYEGQKFVLVGVRSHTRLDGAETVLTDWQAQYPDCGAQFQVTQGAFFRCPPRRRCDDCKRPGVRVRKGPRQ